MKRKKLSIPEMLLSAGELGPEDGVDPRHDTRGEPEKVTNRKALQLCGQVARTLQSVLAGECRDDVLRDLLVESVVPAPNSARVLVTLSLATPRDDVGPAEVLARVQRVQGLLRSEVAAAINRRKTPDLTFRLVGQADLS